MHEELRILFARTFGEPPASVTRVAGDGSQRTYIRMRGGPHGTAIGGHGPDPEENRAFIAFSLAFHGIGLRVPELYAIDETRGLWLAQDLGDTTLFDALTEARAADADATFPAAMVPVYERVVEELPRFQVEGGRVVDYDVAYPRAAFDLQSMRWDLNYFKYHFLKLAHIPFSEQRLENDFDRLTTLLLGADASHFLYRDFQSRNVMLVDGRPWFIDYQGGRRGAPQYDIASLLYDAKADLTDAVRDRLLDRYLAALSAYLPIDRDRFLEEYRGFVLIRIMQAMGAYGYRGFFERKSRFLQSVPYAARNIARLLDRGLPIRLPELEAVFGRIADAWAEAPGGVRPLEGLTVHVTSFSYRKGYPDDVAGHGGGSVFDCRSLPNPGRHAEYADRTGLDENVVAFLEGLEPVAEFWNSVRTLVDVHVANFRERGFSDLAVSFGCTGGQHRSVYFAERITLHIRETHPDVAVRLIHRERPSWPVTRHAELTAESDGRRS
ncbi:MAG TPA: RNase adapter RapZ [Longimicrobiales bacterium]|nr:RNase adapter RapZ [Longimicrobiales bacterium]